MQKLIRSAGRFRLRSGTSTRSAITDCTVADMRVPPPTHPQDLKVFQAWRKLITSVNSVDADSGPQPSFSAHTVPTQLSPLAQQSQTPLGRRRWPSRLLPLAIASAMELKGGFFIRSLPVGSPHRDLLYHCTFKLAAASCLNKSRALFPCSRRGRGGKGERSGAPGVQCCRAVGQRDQCSKNSCSAAATNATLAACSVAHGSWAGARLTGSQYWSMAVICWLE